MEYYVGLDLGTTGIKAVCFDRDGREVLQTQVPAGLETPGPGLAEQNPSAWYEAPCALLRRIAEKIPARRIAGIGISSQGISVVPVDANQRPLRKALSWLDTRAEAETARMGRDMPEEEWHMRTGKPLKSVYTLPKLLWLKEHEPEVFNAADAFLMPMDYFIARAVGERITDPTMAGGTMLFCLTHGRWSGTILSEYGIEWKKLPSVLPTGTLCGYLNAETQLMTGLGPVPVAVGAQDQKIAAYGARLQPGEASLSLGTAGATEVLTDEPRGTGPIFTYVDGTHFCLESCLDTAGAAVKWAKELLLPNGSYENFDALAASAAPGCGGARFSPRLSEGGGWSGVTLSTGRAELLRAVYEGVAAELAALLRQDGEPLRRVLAFGGGTRSALLCQLLADAFGLPLQVTECREMAALGAARSAVTAVGGDAEAFGKALRTVEYLPKGGEA